MYNNTHWEDEIKDASTGRIIRVGTPQSAGNFNNMEKGISDVHIATMLSMIAQHQSAAN